MLPIFSNFLVFFFTTGVGQCLGYSGSFVAVGYNFEGKRSMATGVLVSGFALGQMVHPTMVQLLLDAFAVDGTLLILGAIGFQVCVFACLIRPNKLERDIQRKLRIQAQSSSFLGNCIESFQLFKIMPYSFFCFSILSWSTGLSVMTLYITDFYHHYGATKLEASFLTSLVGVGSFLSRILIGLAVSDGGLDGKVIYFGKYAILFVLTATVTTFGGRLYGKVVYSLFFGLYTGATWTLLSPITIELVGVSHFATAFGIEMLTAGIGFLCGPLMGGEFSS